MIILALTVTLVFLYFALKLLARQANAKGRSPHPAKPTSPGTPARLHKRRPPLPPPLAPPLPPLVACKQEEGDLPAHPFLPDYLICYTDRNRTSTNRRITVVKVDGNMLHAYCHLRHARRSFLIPSISRWTNCSTGEIIEDILEDFRSERKKSAFGSVDRMAEDLYPVMGVLLYFGKSNKRLMIDERNVIISTYKNLCQDPGLTDSMINAGINELATPSTKEYNQLVTALSGMSLEIQTLTADAAMRLLETRKFLSTIEKEGLQELHQQLTVNF